MPTTRLGLACAVVAFLCVRWVGGVAAGQEPDAGNSSLTRGELVEARALYNHAQYGDAAKLYAQICFFEPENKAAREGWQRIKQMWALPGWRKPNSKLSENYPVEPTSYNARIEPWMAKEPEMKIALKLSKIILPEVGLNHVKVSEAVEWLQRESLRLDPDPDPAARGVIISMVPPGDYVMKYESPARLPEQADARISLRLHNATLSEALDFVASQVGLRVAVHPGQITLVQERVHGDNGLFYDQFRAWPGLTNALNDHVKPDYSSFAGYPIIGGHFEIPQADAKAFLESKGIIFPPNATAAYIPPGSFFVSGDPEALAKLEALVDCFDEVGSPPADKQP